jgi:hypothetical protein
MRSGGSLHCSSAKNGQARICKEAQVNETIDADIVIGRLQSELDSARTRQAQSR